MSVFNPQPGNISSGQNIAPGTGVTAGQMYGGMAGMPGFRGSGNYNDVVGYLDPQGGFHSSQASANAYNPMTYGTSSYVNQGPFMGLGGILDAEIEQRQGVADQINQYREDALGLAAETEERRQVGLDTLEGIATGEGLTDLGAAKTESLGMADAMTAERTDRLSESKDEAMGLLEKGQKALEKGEKSAVSRLEKGRQGSMMAMAINAGRQAGEQSAQIASQMAASGASGAQIAQAQMQADRDRGAATAANISQAGAQYDTAIANVNQSFAQLKAQNFSEQAGTVQNFASMMDNAVREGGMAKMNVVESFANMGMAQDAQRQQAAGALANAQATGSQDMVSIVNALPPQTLGSLGLTSELFSVVAQMGGPAGAYGVYGAPEGLT